MLGWMTKKQAIKEGFTHHGSYYGIPLYMTEGDMPIVCPKHYAFEYLMDLAMVIEGLLFPLIHGADAEPVFMFKIGDKIEVKDARPGS